MRQLALRRRVQLRERLRVANLAEQRDNGNYPNFGCATQRNLAVQVANPADLLGPRTESDRPGERRDVVWDKYVKGETTGAKKSEDEKVKVAK